MRRRGPRAWLVATWLIGLLACSAFVQAASPAATSAPARPRLVVFIAVDGLPQRQIVNYRDQLAPDGFARFLTQGSWFANAHYGHAYTVTAPGHATMLTGAYPHRSGIIGNEWRDLQTGQSVYCVSDPAATYIGHATQALDGTSPKNLKVQTLGDVMRTSNPQSRVIAVAGKDRGAILTAGHLGTAYMYMGASGQFASSTYYMKSHPGWVDRFNAQRPADAYFKRQWSPLLPESAYTQSLADNQDWFGPAGGGLPMRFGAADDGAPGPYFYGSLLRGPFVDALTLDFARAALAGERLGQDEATDLLAISLSGHDYVNHSFSAESRLSHDHVLQLDRLLQSFFHDLDARIGRDRYIAVLTSDHGFMPSVEMRLKQGLPAGRLDSGQTLARVNAGLEQRFGSGQWVRSYSGAALLLNRSLLAQRGQTIDTVADAARTLLLAEPGIAAAYTRRELLDNTRMGAPYFGSMQKSWHASVSGDVQFALKPYWMMGSRAAVATHGSPHDYDTHVPLMLFGPTWFAAQKIDQPVEVIDIAPTLALLLGVQPPDASEGHVLPFAKPEKR